MPRPFWQFFARDGYSVEYVPSGRLLIERREELYKIIMGWRRRVRSTTELRWLVDEGEITEDDLATLNPKPSALEVRDARTSVRQQNRHAHAWVIAPLTLPRHLLTGPCDH